MIDARSVTRPAVGAYDHRVIAVASPAAARLREGATGVSLGGGGGTSYIDLEGFVIAITSERVPAMPNGVVVRAPRLTFAPGTPVRVERGVLAAGSEMIPVAGAPITEPALSKNEGRRAADAARRASAILSECGITASSDPTSLADAMAASGMAVANSDPGAGGIVRLLESIARRDSVTAAEAANRLLGRGGGLTPEGDDLLAGAAAAVVAFGRPSGFRGRAGWLAALIPTDVRRRTGALAATLLELAVDGFVVEPLIPVLDLRQRSDVWRTALRRLTAIGHSTGYAWAIGCGAAGLMLAPREAPFVPELPAAAPRAQGKGA